MSYIVADDLLTGDMLITGKVPVDSYIQQGFDAMCVALAECFAMPLPDPGDESLDEKTLDRLKQIQIHYSTAYLFRGQSATTGDEHATEWAEWLIHQAKMFVAGACSTNPGLRLKLPPAQPSPTADPDSQIPANAASPSVLNADASSAVDAFYSTMRDGRFRDWYG